MRFTVYPSKSWEEILPDVREEERDLIGKLVVYENGNRLTADQVCSTSIGCANMIDANAYCRHFATRISSKCVRNKAYYSRFYVHNAHTSSCTHKHRTI